MRRGLLVIISGPSGVGKDTIIKRLLARDKNLRYSVSATTRMPRPGEVPGMNYTFVTREQFEQMVQEGQFMEHAVYDGNLYGTLRERVEQARAEGYDTVLKIDVQGAEQVRHAENDGIFIFVAPPSVEELERRQLLRNSETEADRLSRRQIAELEMTFAPHYDHVVVNDDLDRVVEEILRIIREARERQT
ncbi:MAG TPA: guanylate kinase [Candidatus Dormibacteraeota bacterium]|nr:guanylate kinase [Candidatus Dormibacteraeota bacterium]